ncbi:class I SAM-dependent methyltransferase [Candidatus Woesearchaeota archaeon]|nr:class I SAM-dependent methyltransferase [Candidatus Woesearchaeota archaeon]
MPEMYDDLKHIEDTFTENNLSEYLIQAQWAEFVELKKAITELYEKNKSHLTILDIGVGDARILKHLVGIEEIWKMIKHYEGIDVAQNCIDISNKIIKDLKISKKTSVKLLDAVNLKRLNKKYDLIISTWFTVGNFYPFDFDFKNLKHGQDMSKNDKIETIFKQAYDMLNSGGEIVIGSMYIDNEETRKKQEDSYKSFGWKIITDKRDCFTATKDGWWSLRFTKKRVHDSLNFIPKNKISFIPLDTYNYAMMVRIKK